MLHLLAVLLEVAVGRHQLLGSLLRRPGRLQHRLDALFHLVERLGPGLEAVDARQHLTEPIADRTRLLVDRLERLADLAQLRAARRDLGEHGTERSPLLPRRLDQLVEILDLALCLAAHADPFECVQHVVLPSCPSPVSDEE